MCVFVFVCHCYVIALLCRTPSSHLSTWSGFITLRPHDNQSHKEHKSWLHSNLPIRAPLDALRVRKAEHRVQDPIGAPRTHRKLPWVLQARMDQISLPAGPVFNRAVGKRCWGHVGPSLETDPRPCWPRTRCQYTKLLRRCVFCNYYGMSTGSISPWS